MGETTDGKQLSVLYLNHSCQISGAEQSLRALLWELRRSDAAVDPLVALPGGGPYADLLRGEEFSVTFAPMRRIERPNNPIAGIATLLHIRRTAPFIAKLAQQTGAQLIHSNSTTAHIVGGMAAEQLKIPAVWHVRDLVSLKSVAARLAGNATKIVAISQAVSVKLISDGIPAEKIQVIHNGIDTDEWRARERSQLREALGIAPETFLFGCVTQLVPWKNHAAFIEAAAKLAADENLGNVRFVIMGGDLWGEQQSYVKELRELVKKHNLQDRFNFIPHQSNNVDAISAVDCIVLPSKEEPFGRVLIEGMSLEKAVIAFNAAGPTEIITHEHDGLLAAVGDIESLAANMKRVATDSDLRQTLQTNARATVIQKFHIAECAQKVVELYRSLG